jgi:hypothetical protein
MAPPQKIHTSQSIQAKPVEIQKAPSVTLPALHSTSPANVLSEPVTNSESQGSVIENTIAIADRMQKMSVTSETSSQVLSNKPSMNTMPVMGRTEDDRSHLSNSSTKPASFDTKSMASEHTFAMEEKESLRPDDSASVQAADEEEPFFVPPISGRIDPQIALDGSKSDLRRPLHDESAGLGHTYSRRFPMAMMANPPRFGDIVPNIPPGFPQDGTPITPFPTNQNGVDSLQQYSAAPIPPDEKLIEALGTPKDRLLLLQLEEKFLAFIAQSKYVSRGDCWSNPS